MCLMLLFLFQDDLCKSFGQHEQLTTRINRLLEGYTRDASIFKELLQNADDAGATEVSPVFVSSLVSLPQTVHRRLSRHLFLHRCLLEHPSPLFSVFAPNCAPSALAPSLPPPLSPGTPVPSL